MITLSNHSRHPVVINPSFDITRLDGSHRRGSDARDVATGVWFMGIISLRTSVSHPMGGHEGDEDLRNDGHYDRRHPPIIL